jgi:C4-dicarboxylate-specific signal transduction histidine kinase
MAMSTTAVALFLTVAGIAVFEYVMLRNTLRTQQEMLCEIIGGNSTAAIAFSRADDAASTLATLRANENIRVACIYDNEGKLLAKYAASTEGQANYPAQAQPEGFHLSGNAMEVFRPVKLDGRTVGTIYMRSDLRDLYGRLALYAWISPLILIVASGAGLLIIRRLQRSVSTPVVALAATAQRVSEEKDYSLRAPKSGNDEIGQLADAFNHMLDGIRQRDEQIQHHLREVRSARDELEARVEARTADLKRANADLQEEMLHRQEAERKRAEMQSNLVEASRRAGMADVATGVLHNVGNVLNSVNVSTQIVHDAVKASRVATLAKAAGLLQQHAADMTAFLTNDERGKTLPTFFCKLAGALAEEHTGILKEIDGLASNIAHIREIVAMQQSLSRVSGIRSNVSLGELLEDAIKINHAGLNRHQVMIAREFDPSLMVVVDRHKVLQILINLVSNAKYAVNGSTEPTRRVIVRAAVENQRLRIAIIDNGVGIAPEQMTRIFGFGFTTKKNGHGFGLHSSALAAKELGGSLEVFSEGLGKGATFTLTMPLEKEGAHVH